jgi:very-short-patch-repair endonuclease
MKTSTSEYPMYFGAIPDIFKKAKELRQIETEAEALLWSKLNNKQILDLKFRRQHPINKFIADFYCPAIKLVIEVDGGIHELPENKSYDIDRTEQLNEFGITVIRFSNKHVMDSINLVVDQIKHIAVKLLSEQKKVPHLGDLGGKSK